MITSFNRILGQLESHYGKTIRLSEFIIVSNMENNENELLKKNN